MFNKARLENLHIMLTYNFANKGSDSLYEYLYKCIKNDILLGNLGVHEKLPSKRSFAKNLGISVITVENAYEQLMAEGYIYSIPKKGFYVADLRELNLTKTLKKKFLILRTLQVIRQTVRSSPLQSGQERCVNY